VVGFSESGNGLSGPIKRREFIYRPIATNVSTKPLHTGVT
jgi:hypothetical protein